jgi:hypothetical protein
MTIVNDDSSIVNKIGASLTDNAKVVIYDRRMFIVLATDPYPTFQTYSAPASLAHNRVWFNYRPREQRMTAAARGVNATVVEKDIGTINGVIHVSTFITLSFFVSGLVPGK